MFDLFKNFAELMARSQLAVDEVINAVGSLTVDHQMSLEVQPSSDFFSDAAIVRDHDPNQPAYLRLQLNQPIPLQQMVDVFGDYHTPPPLQRGGDRKAIFDAVATSDTHEAILVASMDRNHVVSSVTIQRSVKLDDDM